MKARRYLTSYCVILVVLGMLPLAQGQHESSDEASLAALIKSYYAAYAQKDLGALVGLWSERSPDLAVSIEEAQKTLAVDDYAFSNVAVSLARLAGNKAILQVTANATITNPQTRATRGERSIRNFALIKERSQWKVWRDAPASQDLSAFLEKGSEWKISRDTIEQFVNVLVAVRTEEERSKLLADNQQMMSRELRESLVRRAAPEHASGRYDSALRILQIALAVAERASDKEGVAIAQRGMGDAFRALGRMSQALEHYQKALALFEPMGLRSEARHLRSERAVTLVDIGQMHFAQRKHELAIESYSKALADYEALKDTAATANTLEEIGSVYYDLEKYDRALELFEKCLKLRKTFAGEAVIASTINSIGNVYFQQQEYDSAIQRYQSALAGFEDLKDTDAIVSTMSNIGAVAYAQGNADIALDYYQRALKLQEALRDRSVAADLRLNIATAYASQGNYSPALDNLQKAVAIFEALRDKNKMAGALSDIAEAYFQLHSYSLSLEHYQKSVKLYEELKSLADTSMKLYAIGNVHFVMGNFDLAIESYQKALAQFEAIKHAPGVASMLASIAGTYYAQQKYELALDFYQKSLAQYDALGDRARGSGVVERIASVYYSQGRYAESLEWAARAVTVAEQVANLETLWRARLTQGLAYRVLDRIDEAQRSFAQSIANIESMRNKLVRGEPDAQRFFQGRNAAYLAMMELLVAQNKVTEAFAYAERTRVNTLLDILQRAQITKSMSAPEQQQERKFQNAVASIKAQISRERERKQPDEQRLANLDGRLQKALQDYREFEIRLYTAHPRLKTLRGESEPIKLEDASSVVPDSTTALLQFAVADSRTYLFVLTRSGGGRPSSSVRAQTPAFLLNAYVINVGRVQLAERIAKFQEQIAQKHEGVQQTARELHELLLAPAAGQLTGKATWLIVPDDALWGLPFAALQPSENHYLIEERALAYAPSLSALSEMMKPHATARSTGMPSGMPRPALLAFGNPVISKQTAQRLMLVGDRGNLDSSPESETEVKSLEHLYAPARIKAYVGAQASEALAKQESDKFSMIHFAAPARLNGASPLYSHIALSQSEENTSEDGLLEAWEIMRLNLKVDLIALSASELARERMSSGEALIGLSWALFVAGCPTTALSQWKVNAPSTTALMLEFHGNLKPDSRAAPTSRRSRLAQDPRPGIGAAQALRRAMLKLLARDLYRHLFYWAGFEVIGNGR